MKKRRSIIHTTALLASSFAAMVPAQALKASEAREVKKARLAVPGGAASAPGAGAVDGPPDLTAMLARMAEALADFVPELRALNPLPGVTFERVAPSSEGRFPWKERIVTTTFWAGEKPTRANPVPNHMSAWDMEWAKNFGGTDDPDPKQRVNFRPAGFIPRLNPFYFALPYNDLIETGHKPGAEKVVPWFKEDFKGRGVSVLRDRWIAIRFGERVAYAQWQDCGPFSTDHAEYVFGDARPKPNMNQGAGLDVSPAVRDFLGMKDTDVTDWRFVEVAEVPDGPWRRYGENNHFVQERREAERLAAERKLALEGRARPGGG